MRAAANTKNLRSPGRTQVATSVSFFLLSLTVLSARAEIATQISAGAGGGACAVDAAGALWCWGGCSSAEVVPGLSSGVAYVSAGYNHVCVVTTSGGAKCFGQNLYGELGDGTTTDSDTPVDVVGLTSDVAQISAGRATCAVTTSGAAKCWGRNTDGQLGDGTTTNRSVPVDVLGLGSGVAAVEAGVEHGCALTTAGGVKCWGSSWRGQLGNGVSGQGTFSSTPVDVIGLTSGVVAISAGFTHNCALLGSGAVHCWGSDYGSTPEEVAGLPTGIVSLEAAPGAFATCVVTNANQVACFGSNSVGGGHPGPATAVGVGPDGVWGVTPAGEVRVPYLCFWPDACVEPFGDSDGDGVCEEDDPCNNPGAMQTFPRQGVTPKDPNPPIKVRGLPPQHPAPGNVQIHFKRRFELLPGTSFGDVDLSNQGARLVFFTADGNPIDLVLPPGPYGGPGTAGWSINPAQTVWRFTDSTGGPSGRAVVTKMTVKNRGAGVEGPLVDVDLLSRGATASSSSSKRQVALILGNDAAADAGLCAQGN